MHEVVSCKQMFGAVVHSKACRMFRAPPGCDAPRRAAVKEQKQAAEAALVKELPADLLSGVELDTKLKECLTGCFVEKETANAAEELQVLCFEGLHQHQPPISHPWLACV